MVRPRHRLQFALRMLVLGLLALGMALTPVLASVGELHEVASGSHESATHGDHHATSADSHDAGEADAHGDEGEESDPLHALHHFAHCCGQQSLTASAPMPLLAPPTSGAVLLMPDAQDVPRSPALAPFRPPITT